MTRLCIIVLIAVTPLLLWLLWRRATLRAGANRSQRSATNATFADKINTGIVEVDRVPDHPPLPEMEEGSHKEAKDRPEEEHADALQVGVSAQQNFEANLSGEAKGATFIVRDQAEPGQQFTQVNSNNFPLLPAQASWERRMSALDTGTGRIAGEEFSEKPIISTTAPTLAPGHGVQTEHKVPEIQNVPLVSESPDDELALTKADTEQARPAQRTEDTAGADSEGASLRYRPPPQRPPRSATTAPVKQSSESTTPSEVALDIRIRLTFDRMGSCEIWLLPARTSELDNEIEVRLRGIPLRLVAQDDWYQDLQLANVGDILREGLELKGILASHRRARWLLTGRDVYVLASHQRASGFVSTNRLALGRSHVVLCVAELLPQVEAILNEAGCQDYTKLDEARGVPPGWVGLRGVAPTNAVSLDPGIDRFYAIKPAPDIEIELEGGVWLRSSVWLAGFPPHIRLLGQANGPIKVLIDGKEAHQTGDGTFAVEGYDLCGQHSVYCEGLSCSCSYSIEEPPDSWHEWPAYRFSQAGVCGPLVQLAPEAASMRAFTVPMSNPLLLGAEPGQIFRCSSRIVASWKGLVPFNVVWALPADPLTCDKKTARILYFSGTPIAPHKTHTGAAVRWSTAILDASRKGLRIDDGSPDSTALWRDYKKAARKIWRAAR